MGPNSRHQCLIYEGSPALQLPVLAEVAREKLDQNFRCLYLNSPAMVASMRSHLVASSVNVDEETAGGSLILSSEQNLKDGEYFDVPRMINGLKNVLDRALDDGYVGLWATGDMTWEIGPRKDFSKLLEYEWKLEEFFQENPKMTGVCQYRADIMPRIAMRQGLLSHASILVNETLSLVNPRYLHPERFTNEAAENFELDAFINRLIADGRLN